ncbi:MAG: hypothetical protein LUD47_02065 [Clostridia bacterium]|nr:hypothetical protein [Clostridia bacterium]
MPKTKKDQKQNGEEEEEVKSKDYTPAREFVDLLAGAAFPFIIQLVFSATVMVFANAMDAVAVVIIALVIGEGLLIGAYVLFGMRSGSVAYSRFVQGQKIRDEDPLMNAGFKKVGEYKIYKGFLIGFISIVPCIIFHIFYLAIPNSFCEFLMQYVFSWEFAPSIIYVSCGGITIAELPPYVNALSMLVAIYPIILHGTMYYVGMKREYKKQEIVRIADEARAKEFEEMERERQERAERMRAEAAKNKKKK